MHKIRYRIALLTGGTVLLMLLIIMAVFNYSIMHRIAEQADLSLRHSLPVDTADIETEHPYLLYSPEQIYVTDGKQEQLYSPKEQAMLRTSGSQAFGQTLKTVIGGSTYYVLRTEVTDDMMLVFNSVVVSSEDGESTEADAIEDNMAISVWSDESAISDADGLLESYEVKEIVSYVDITGELDMIRQINLIFLLTALVIGMFGTTAGFVLGKKLEQNQLVQKQFFENTSHELKTPLTAIRGYAEGISKGVITDYPKTGRVIAEQTEKMSRLVEEILCLAKLEGGAVKPEKEPVDIPDFIQDCLMPFEGTVLSRGLQVQLDLKPMTASADPLQLEHALTNLLTNALKYAQTQIRISCGEGKIIIENDCAPLREEDLMHLFERFYTGRDGNTGIGLALAKDILALHGWNIVAEPAENGIRFVISGITAR